MAVVEIEINNYVAVLTLNRPEARNALNPELIVALARSWEQLADDDSVRAIVITGAEGSTFCSGFDLGTTIPLMTGSREPQDEYEQAVADDMGLMGRATLRDFDPGKPTIAAVNGHAIAGGMELMLACDLRAVASGVRLGLSEVALGLIPGMGGTARLARHVPRAIAMELLLTAQPMLSDALAETGLINRLVRVEDVLAAAVDLASTIAANAPLAARAARSVIRACDDLTELDALALEAERGRELVETEDAREGPRAFIEKRMPVFTGR
ncbi:MAG: crotonase/enoyl-CoA hydratase family protein [Actinomycetia bacterium]|nr:crotonase/enoyl-CoA hydratase family protein [Actinomycetes bacterium]